MPAIAFAAPEITQAAGHLDLGVESAATARARRSGDGYTVSGIEWMPDDAYEIRESLRLAVRSAGWATCLTQTARAGDVPVFLHTHPHGAAMFSEADDGVDRVIGETLRRVADCRIFLSAVIAGSRSHPRITARRVIDGRPGTPEAVRVAGAGVTVHGAPALDAGLDLIDVFDRQNRALGPQGRRLLGNLTVGIVGAGGTGSPTAEQLQRLGIHHLILVDDDVVTPSTPTRGTGTGLADLGRPKVDVIADLNTRIGLGATTVEPIALNVRAPRAIDALSRCDLVFGCTDGHASRLVLNRLAYWHLVPVIDMGVLVSSTADGGITGVHARVTLIGPGAACLLCRQRVDPAIAAAELLDPAERRARAAQGYVPDLADPAPSVVSYTTMISTYAVTEFLHRLFHIGDHPYTELLLQLDQPAVRLNDRPGRPGCFCTDPTRWGRGSVEPPIDLVA